MKKIENYIAQGNVFPSLDTSHVQEPIIPTFLQVNDKISIDRFGKRQPILKTPTIARPSRKTETLSPLAVDYFKALDRARTLEEQVGKLTRDIEARNVYVDLLHGQLADTKKQAEQAENQAQKYQANLLSATQYIAETEERARKQLEAERAKRMQLEEELANLRRMRDQQRQSQTNTPHEYYAVLGLDPRTAFIGLSEEQIQRVLQGVYRSRSQIHHPDNGGDTTTMQKVNSAYEALKDPKKRSPSV